MLKIISDMKLIRKIINSEVKHQYPSEVLYMKPGYYMVEIFHPEKTTEYIQILKSVETKKFLYLIGEHESFHIASYWFPGVDAMYIRCYCNKISIVDIIKKEFRNEHRI